MISIHYIYLELACDIIALGQRGGVWRGGNRKATQRNSAISRTTAPQKANQVSHFQPVQGREGGLQRESNPQVGLRGEGERAAVGEAWAPAPQLNQLQSLLCASQCLGW